jgi:hypothetical protein
MHRMLSKLRKTPSGTPLPPDGKEPVAYPGPQPRVKPPRTRSFSDALGGLKLRAAATQVHDSISNLRRSGSVRLKSALTRRHPAPAELGRPTPDASAVAEVAELPGSPLRPVMRPRTPPSLDAAGMLRADLPATHLVQIAKRPFDAPWLAQQRELAVQRNDAQALQAQRAFLNQLHLDAIYRARDLSARFAGLPLAAETLELIEQTKLDIAQQVTREKLAVMAAEKQLRLEPPPVPPRPNVHELP